MRGGTTVAVGTTKGLFLFGGDRVEGPFFKGERVPSVALDARREPTRILAGTVNEVWGSGVRTSDDGGRTWTDPAERPLKFPADSGAALAQVWQLQPTGAEDPDTFYAGVEPAALFRSDDRGDSWSLVRGLWDHRHRTEWVPGFGGLGLHTVLLDPRDANRIMIAISAGGVYRSDDRGDTWIARNVGVARAPQRDYPEFGQCVHKVARDAIDPDRLFMQNHGGLYRSDDNGDTWQDVANGVPSDFGFPIVTHPRVADTAYVVPLESAEYRATPEARCRVYRTMDAGVSWSPLTEGLPQQDAHLAVLRDAFCHDGLDPLGLYFGTRTGEVYESADEGESWQLLVEHLPPVLCVRAAPIEL